VKVGDLVCLSAYGQKVRYNSNVWAIDPKQVGLVIKTDVYGSVFKIRWTKSTMPRWHFFDRRELKYARLSDRIS